MAERNAKNDKLKQKKRAARGLPSREAILQYIADNPDMSGKKEISRAFGLKGSAKIDLKAMLKEMAEDGLIEKRGKRLQRPGDLAKVSVLDIVARDRDGGLLAKPADYREIEGKKPPVILIRPPRKSDPVPGLGSKVLARLERNSEEGVDYTAKVIKILERQQTAEIGILRIGEKEARLIPISKKQDERIIPLDQLNNAEDGDLVEIEPLRSNSRNDRYGLKKGKVRQVVGSQITEQAASMIAIHANEIPHVFPEDVLSEAKAAKPIALKGKGGVAQSHEDWRDLPLITIDPADAKDHDDAIHGMPDPDVNGGYIATVAIADVSFYVRSGSTMDREALLRGNSVYFPDRVVPMLSLIHI